MNEMHENIFDSIAGLRDQYKRILINGLEEGLSVIGATAATTQFIGTYYDFPTLKYKKNGLPELSQTIGNEPIDYRKCFSSLNGKPLVNETEIKAFSDLIAFVKSDINLYQRFCFETIKGTDFDFDSVVPIFVSNEIKNVLEKYIHTFSSFDFSEERANQVIEPAVSYIFDKSLNVDIYIPILFLDFQANEFEISKGVYIQRIHDKQHLARYTIESNNTSNHKSVIASATHALVLKGWSVPNHKHILDFNILLKQRAYPIELIEKFFGALRISSSIHTGFAQIMAQSVGWSGLCKADIPYMRGVSVRSYPAWFEDYYWNLDTIPSLSLQDMQSLSTIYNQLISATENSIDLSVKRLNRCLVRDNDEDSVLDATIALEALLSDDGNQEMTHKLAMRVGALSKLDKSFSKSPQQAFKDIKSIYSYRSAIVHGSKNLEKRKIIAIDESNKIHANTLAVEYVRMLLKVLLANPHYRDPVKIDQILLLGMDTKTIENISTSANDF